MNTIERNFYVGSAHRLADGSISHYVRGRRQFNSLEAVENYISNVCDSYKERGTLIQVNEFVAIEVLTTIHLNKG